MKKYQQLFFILTLFLVIAGQARAELMAGQLKDRRGVNQKKIAMGALIWSELGQVEKSDGTQFQIRTNVFGARFLLQKEYGKTFVWNNAMIIAQGNSQNAHSDFIYFHHGATAFALQTAIGQRWRFESESGPGSAVSLGYILPVTIRNIQYQFPSASYKATTGTKVLLHAGLSLGWQLSPGLEIVQEFLMPLNGAGSQWSVNFVF